MCGSCFDCRLRLSEWRPHQGLCLQRVSLMFGETIRGLEDHQRTIGGTWDDHGASLTQDDAIQAKMKLTVNLEYTRGKDLSCIRAETEREAFKKGSTFRLFTNYFYFQKQKAGNCL